MRLKRKQAGEEPGRKYKFVSVVNDQGFIEGEPCLLLRAALLPEVTAKPSRNCVTINAVAFHWRLDLRKDVKRDDCLVTKTCFEFSRLIDSISCIGSHSVHQPFLEACCGVIVMPPPAAFASTHGIPYRVWPGGVQASTC